MALALVLLLPPTLDSFHLTFFIAFECSRKPECLKTGLGISQTTSGVSRRCHGEKQIRFGKSPEMWNQTSRGCYGWQKPFTAHRPPPQRCSVTHPSSRALVDGWIGAAGKHRAPGQEGPAGVEEEEEGFLFLILAKMSLYWWGQIL